VVERELEPCTRMRRPDALLVAARVHVEHVRDAPLVELSVEELVLVTEAVVATADVEREERGTPRERATKRRDERVRAGVRVS